MRYRGSYTREEKDPRTVKGGIKMTLEQQTLRSTSPNGSGLVHSSKKFINRMRLTDYQLFLN